jgi:hypothetical protein
LHGGIIEATALSALSEGTQLAPVLRCGTNK